MATNWISALIEFLERFWPLVRIEQWERGCFYLFGRARKRVLKPGIYPIVPWFTGIETASVVPTVLTTPLLNLTLKDGRTLVYSVTSVVRIYDVYKALNEIDDYKESTAELISRRVSEKLADVDAARVDPENRRRLLTDLKRWLNEELQPYGIELLDFGFTTCLLNQKVYRLMSDTALSSAAW